MTTAKFAIDLKIYRRLLLQVKPYWFHIVGTFVLDLLSTPLALLTPLPLKIVVDNVIGSQPLPSFLDALLPATLTRSKTTLLIFAASFVIFIALLRPLLGLASSLLRTYTSEKMVLDFRARLLHHAQCVSLSYHDSVGTFDSTYRIQYDAPAIQWTTIDGIVPLFITGLWLVGMFYVTALIDWQLALIALLVSPFLFLVTRISSGSLRTQWLDYQKFESLAMSVVQEVLGAVRVVKAFGREERERERFVSNFSKAIWIRMRVVAIQNFVSSLINVITAVGYAVILYMGVRHVQTGILTLGELLVVEAYIIQLYGPLQSIGNQVTGLQRSLASAERAFLLLDQAPDVVESKQAQPISRALGAVSFHNVSFAFDNHQVLRGISFEIPAGTHLGIAGRTGAGKTTLVNLLMRFFDPTNGKILLDGVDLRDYKLADLRNQFAIVLQEPVLFSTSIAENIAYAKPDASDREIIAAAKAANAHDFISKLPQGYETQVGERGMCLSGGERQRISLARAFLKDAPILILDEPTSSVDTKTETAIMEAMERLVYGRTTFMIAHRLSTLEICDLRMEIEDGRLINLIAA
ncbi:MAG: ABC transporter ATP-binding protein [Nostoc sp. CmiVER01]|uniref:ABC transporter ATP-binding protein n=1 Tax=Nostoc sp. CmiVER01 TaxID=3075384 RepID=UPI002AD26DF9|nr:ABC transporter ATP-binding protein [Nostoc sp. CmiVER01]MDZ8121333.1 ABC transporter ATP-binding protein [Nostoc sp. CmiVER01]